MTADFSQKSNIQISTALRASTTSTTTYEDSSNCTYDSAIEDYKSRVSKAVNSRVFYETENRERESAKLDLPKVDISKRRELFEKENSPNSGANTNKSPLVEVVSIKDRISSLQNNLQASSSTTTGKKIEVDTTTKLKDRLSSLHSSVSVEDFKRPLDPENLISRKEFENRQNLMEKPAGLAINEDNESLDTDREDSGIHTTDVSCSVSQSDEQQEQEQQIEEVEHVMTPAAVHQSQDKEIEMLENLHEVQEAENDNDESVSDEEPLSPQSVLEGKLILNINGDRSNPVEVITSPKHNNNINSSNNSKCTVVAMLEKNGVAEKIAKFSNSSSDTISSSKSNANQKNNQQQIFNFIRTNMGLEMGMGLDLGGGDDDNQQQRDEIANLESVDVDCVVGNYNDNNYVYECIKINKKNNTLGKCGGNALEKSNSVDTAMSLCSSSEVESLMEDNDTDKSLSIIDK